MLPEPYKRVLHRNFLKNFNVVHKYQCSVIVIHLVSVMSAFRRYDILWNNIYVKIFIHLSKRFYIVGRWFFLSIRTALFVVHVVLGTTISWSLLNIMLCLIADYIMYNCKNIHHIDFSLLVLYMTVKNMWLIIK